MTTVGGRSAGRAQARRAGDLLRWTLAAIDDAAGEAPSAAGIDDLVDRAEYHRITPILHAVAPRVADLDPAAAADLAESYHFAVRRHLFVLDDLGLVSETLAELDPDVLVIKGPVLSSVVYPRPDLRSYGDLDIVVRPEAFSRAVELLVDAGATFLEPDWDAVVARRLGEVALALPSGTVVDLHWHLIPIGIMRDRFTVPTDELFERARTVDLDGRPARTLGADDTVVHLALHAVLCGGDRLGWLADLQRSLQPRQGDVPELGRVVVTARAWGAVGALASQMARIDRILGPVPGAEGALGSATARVARGTTDLADRIHPIERSNGARTLGVALSWSAAPTLSASAVELAHMGARWARRRGLEPPQTDERRPPVPPTTGQWQRYLATVDSS